MARELIPLTQQDYEAIEAAVMETERGRWFLREYARRNRNADTSVLLDAIQKLERATENAAARASSGVYAGDGSAASRIRIDIVEMASAITETKREIASMRAGGAEESQFAIAAGELDAIVTATEKATQNILESAEHIQEAAWTMREAGVQEDFCEKLDALVTDIYTACSFQDITGQRISKVVALLEFLEERIAAMRAIWGTDDAVPASRTSKGDTRPDAHLLNGPQREGHTPSQDDVDLMMVDLDIDADLDMPSASRTASAADLPEEDSDESLFAAAPPSAAAQPVGQETVAPHAEALEDEILFQEDDVRIDVVTAAAEHSGGIGIEDDDIFDAAPPAYTLRKPSAREVVELADTDAEPAGEAQAADGSPEASPPQATAADPASEAGEEASKGEEVDFDSLDPEERLVLFS